MKPKREKKVSFRASLKKKLGRGKQSSSSDPDLVEVLELPEEEMKKTPKKRLDQHPSSLQACTPLGTPSSKRQKVFGGRVPVTPLDLTPPKREVTEVVVVEPFLEDSGNLSVSSDSLSSLESSPSSEQSDSGSSLTLYELEESDGSISSSGEISPSPPSSGSGEESSVSPEFESQGPSDNTGQQVDDDDDTSYMIISLKDSSAYLLLLNRGGTTMPVRGLANIKSLWGTVSILGYDISPETRDPIPVFCPSNVGFLCLETSQGKREELDASDRATLKERLANIKLQSGSLDDLLLDMTSDSVLLHVSRLNHKPSKFLTSFNTYRHLYTGGSAKKTLHRTEISVCHKVGLYMSPPNGAQPQNVVETLTDYQTAASSVLQAVRSKTSIPRVLFVGPKNSGKSTALRYIINRLQSCSTDVCYMECDPGQTEFTAPAILSLHIIRQPLLGPPFTHPHEAELSFFLGDVNAADHANNYLKMVAALYQHYRTSLSHMPLFINTMGWVEGLGLRLLREIAGHVHPTHLVQLVPQNEQPITVYAQDGDDEDLCSFVMSSIVDRSPPTPTQVVIETNCQTDSYQASPLRELSLLASISSLLDLDPQASSILSLRPTPIPWGQVCLRVCHQTVPISQTLYAANASIIALCKTSPKELQRVGAEESREGLRVLSANPVSECHGMGIIRGIDPEEKLFYILPAPGPDILTKINTLLVGSLAIPQCILLQQHTSDEIPYVTESFDSQVSGSLAVKPKTYLRRGPGGRGDKT